MQDKTMSVSISLLIYANNNQDKLFVKGLSEDAKSLSFTNMLGQNIKTLNEISETQDNKQITKKIILE